MCAGVHLTYRVSKSLAKSKSSVSHLQGVKELGQIKVLSLQGLLAHQLVQYVEDFFGLGKVLHLEQSTSHVHVDVPH